MLTPETAGCEALFTEEVSAAMSKEPVMSEYDIPTRSMTLEELAGLVAGFREQTHLLQAENARLHERLSRLEHTRRQPAPAPADPTPTPPAVDALVPGQPVSRRGALRAIGAATAGGVGLALGSTVLAADPAAAQGVQGTAMICGEDNTATGLTEIYLSNASMSFNQTTLYAIGSGAYAGVRGDGGTNGGMGIYGQGGTTSGPGVQSFGGSPNGDGVQGTASGTGNGVSGQATTGAGVIGFSSGADGVGVSGDSSGALSYGVYGSSSGGTGCVGVGAFVSEGGGMAGKASAMLDSIGVAGYSDTGYGVVGSPAS